MHPVTRIFRFEKGFIILIPFNSYALLCVGLLYT